MSLWVQLRSNRFYVLIKISPVVSLKTTAEKNQCFVSSVVSRSVSQAVRCVPAKRSSDAHIMSWAYMPWMTFWIETCTRWKNNSCMVWLETPLNCSNSIMSVLYRIGCVGFVQFKWVASSVIASFWSDAIFDDSWTRSLLTSLPPSVRLLSMLYRMIACRQSYSRSSMHKCANLNRRLWNNCASFSICEYFSLGFFTLSTNL